MCDTAKIVIDGGSEWRIYTPAGATPMEQYAAQELQRFICESTGAKLPVTQGEAIDPAIIISTRSGDEQGEGYQIDIAPTRICITGGGVRGTLYGVYEFLERYVGVRFLTSTRNYVPHRHSLQVPCGAIHGQSALKFRIAPFKCACEPAIQGRLRLNLGNTRFEGEYAQLTDIGKTPAYAYGHSIADIVPDELFDAHPEYFPFFDGQRRHGPHHQRCLTNPAVKDMAIAWAKKRLRDNPTQRLIAIGQNDTYPDKPNCCRCPACAAIDDQEGTPMGSLLTFVNAVAEALEPEFPDVTVTTLAYRYTRTAPKTIRPRRNVAIVLCSIECCFSHPLDAHCGAKYTDISAGQVDNDAFVADIEAWSAIADQLFIWDYVTNFKHYLAPHPNFDALGENMRFFAAHKACGVYPEGAHDDIGAEMDELRTYVLSRLMWDPSRDAWHEAREFLTCALGPAAVPVLDYMKLLHNRVKGENIHISTYHEPDERTFPKALVEQAKALFADALTLAPDDEARAMIQRMAMSVRYVELCLYSGHLPPQERQRLAHEYMADMRRLGIEGLSEGGSSEQATRDRLAALLA